MYIFMSIKNKEFHTLYILLVFLPEIYYAATYCWVCRSNAEFEQEWYQIAQYSFCSRYRTCLDTFSNLYTECETHQNPYVFDL